MNEPTNHSVEKFLKEFQVTNEKIEPLELCLCVLADGAHRILPILPSGKFLDGENEVEAVWFCKASSATRLIGQLFSTRENQPTDHKTTKEQYEKD